MTAIALVEVPDEHVFIKARNSTKIQFYLGAVIVFSNFTFNFFGKLDQAGTKEPVFEVL